MSIALTLVLVVLAAAVIAYPFFINRRERTEVEAAAPKDVRPGLSGELEADYQAGILSKEEYEELSRGREGETRDAGPTVAQASVDDEIERRVRERRAAGKPGRTGAGGRMRGSARAAPSAGKRARDSRP